MYLDIYTGTTIKTRFSQQLWEIMFLAVECALPLPPPQKMLYKFHKFRILAYEQLHESEVFLIRLHKTIKI